jgi:hypothetical protein
VAERRGVSQLFAHGAITDEAKIAALGDNAARKMPRGYLVRSTTIAMVKKAIVVIKRLWPQRAISPIMLQFPMKTKLCSLVRGCDSLPLSWVPHSTIQLQRRA